MFIVNKNEYRNLQEQVLDNQNKIRAHWEVDRVIAEFGLRVIGRVDTEADITEQPVPESGYQYGDAYAVGTEPPYDYSVYTRPFAGETEGHWFNIGKLSLQGPQGPKGDQGPQGIPGTNTRWYRIDSFTDLDTNEELVNAPKGTFALITGYSNADTGELLPLSGTVYYKYSDTPGYWESAGDIRGPQGYRGERGPQGPQGLQGIQGNKGDTGERGLGLVILGNDLASVNSLPSPTTVRRDGAYLVNINNEKHLYAITGLGTAASPLIWEDLGVYALTSSGGGSTLYRHDLEIRCPSYYGICNAFITIINTTPYSINADSNPIYQYVGVGRIPATGDASEEATYGNIFAIKFFDDNSFIVSIKDQHNDEQNLSFIYNETGTSTIIDTIYQIT